jgi:glycosyltransferase involved in cell wall biosynthesis
MTPAATLIIPLLNQVDAWLDQAVRSALAQTVPCEVLVVVSARTGQSNRETLALLQRDFPGLSITQPPREGFAAGLNHGIQSASTERVGLLLSDDWLEPAAVEESLRHCADIVSTGRTLYAADGMTPLEPAPRILTKEAFDRLPDLERQAKWLGHFLLFQKRKVLEVGGLDESLGDSPGIDDYDLLWTLLEHGASVSIVENSLYNYRDHAGDRLTTRRREDMIATMKRILAKHNIAGQRAEELLAQHARWFGRPMYEVMRDAAEVP